jgi:LPXTG-site transpeptidase (sortase) family protein
MKSKILFLIFLFVLSLASLVFSARIFSQEITIGTSINPGFPLVGEQQPEEVTTTPKILEPLAIFEEVSTADTLLPTSSIDQSFSVEEVPVKSIIINKPKPIQKAVVAAQSSHLLGRLIIPSVSLDVAIGSVSLTPTGNMDVLDDPARVSWYKDGTVPGEKGSAVIGAHVFQSFARLKDVKLGDSIYVANEGGSKLRFVVSEIEVYPYTTTESLPKIFNRADKIRLNLITCDGELTANRLTYDRRLIVFAELGD